VPTIKNLVDSGLSQTGLLTGEPVGLVPIGVPKFDAVIKMDKGTGGVLAADTGVGKSTLALVLLLERRKAGLNTVYVSTEDPLPVVFTRIVALLADVSATAMRMGSLTPGDIVKVKRCAEELREDENIILEFPSAEIHDVERSVARGVADGADFAIVDYLQAISGAGYGSERERINEVFRTSKEAAGLEGGAMMMVSQMRRLGFGESVYTRHHIKGSGDISNNARLILIAESARDSADTVYLKVEKSTVGGEGMVQTYKRRRESGMLTPMRPKESAI
jgi:hypothetical protein